MQVIYHAIALVFFPVPSGSSPCASPVRAQPFRRPALFSRCATWLDSPQDSAWQTAPPFQYLVLITAGKVPSATSSIVPQAIKPPPLSASPCGLGSCSARVTTNPLHFIMQVIYHAIALVFFPVPSGSSPCASPVRAQPFRRPALFSRCATWLDSPQDSAWQTAPPFQYLVLITAGKVPSATSSIVPQAIKPPPLSASPCGLGSCSARVTTNPLHFIMQVGPSYSLYAKKSSNYFLLQLPSPQRLFATCCECGAVVRSLLLVAGDIESNPGPDNAAILAELRKLTAGQSTVIAEIKDIKAQLVTTNNSIADLAKRVASVEAHCEHIEHLRQQLGTVQTDNEKTLCRVSDLESRFDDAENRSRRNNLIFYGIPDSTSEPRAHPEETIIQLCSERLNISLDTKEIERAHRLGRYNTGRNRPIIVRFSAFKTKEAILTNARKLKGTTYSIGEDFSRRVQSARRHLIAFAKSKSVPFSLRYKTLHIGSQRFFYDEASQSVRAQL
uniref:Putative tick transposon n=1 Tax=Rhipicephalus pulchellus TaxID=72859 RepID=L7LVD0_RHIPC